MSDTRPRKGGRPAINWVDAFSGLGEDALAALQEAAVTRTIKGGQYLVRFGEAADTLYMVMTGRFYVGLPDGRLIAEIGAGEPIGELAFFAGGDRTADIIAARDSIVLELTREAYDTVTQQHREVVDSILVDTAKRLARSTSGKDNTNENRRAVLALLPAADVHLPENLTRALGAAMQDYEDIRLVGEGELPEEVAPEDGAFGHWIAELENGGERLVLVGGEDDAWNRAIARNADEAIFLAALGHGNGFLSPLEEYAYTLFPSHSRSLILWRSSHEDPIENTARWLDRREVHLHHHLGLDEPKDFARVARFLCHRANGVVLAGGGALGCAHIGVMQALLESDIPIDYFGGASVGAAMAGALATGITAEDLLIQMQDMFVTKKAMRRPTIPVHSFLDQRVFDEQLQLRYGETDIADLPFNFFAVSTNLSLNRQHIHRRGPLWEAIRASGSLPTILPPFVTRGGDVLVDGGVLDNVPVDVMRASKWGPNVVVALRPAPGEAWRINATYEDIRTPWRILRDFLLRRKPKEQFPSIIEVMSRAMVVSSEGSVEDVLSRADVLLIPPIPPEMQILDWHRGAEISELSRHFTLDAIEQRPELAAMKAR